MKHFFRGLGWVIQAIFWARETAGFLETNFTNAIFTAGAVGLFGYVAYHEYLCYVRNEELRPLRFLAGIAFFAGTAYYLIEGIPEISGALVLVTAKVTVGLMNGFGFDYHLGSLGYDSVRGSFIPVHPGAISIILGCTGIQAMVIFAAAILSVKADRKRKYKAFLGTVPVIFVLNQVRNIGIIYLVDHQGFNFEFVHSYVGKFFSLIVLIYLAMFVFDTLPEVHNNILGLFDLPKRDKLGVVDGYVPYKGQNAGKKDDESKEKKEGAAEKKDSEVEELEKEDDGGSDEGSQEDVKEGAKEEKGPEEVEEKDGEEEGEKDDQKEGDEEK